MYIYFLFYLTKLTNYNWGMLLNKKKNAKWRQSEIFLLHWWIVLNICTKILTEITLQADCYSEPILHNMRRSSDLQENYSFAKNKQFSLRYKVLCQENTQGAVLLKCTESVYSHQLLCMSKLSEIYWTTFLSSIVNEHL